MADGYRMPRGERERTMLVTLAESDDLLAIAASAAPDRLPALLFTAAAKYLVLRDQPASLIGDFVSRGAAEGRVDAGFRERYQRFCRERADEIRGLLAIRRYQMSEVGRSAHLLAGLALAQSLADGRPLALIDVGAGAGLQLHLDRYGYRYLEAAAADGTGHGREAIAWGDRHSGVVLECELHGGLLPPLPRAPLSIAERIGIDLAPVDLDDRDALLWMRACLPLGFDRFERAVEIARADRTRILAGDALERLAEVAEHLPANRLLCIVDSYVLIFFPEAEQRRFAELVGAIGRKRDLAWISLDPLAPLGDGTLSVQGLGLPATLPSRAHREGIFGLLGAVGYAAGERCWGRPLALGHPSGMWLEWLDRESAAATPVRTGS